VRLRKPEILHGVSQGGIPDPGMPVINRQPA